MKKGNKVEAFQLLFEPKKFSMFSRFSVNQIIMPTTEFTTAQLLLSGAIMGISTNLTTYGIYNDRVKQPTISYFPFAKLPASE